jgi:hypothetical protein
MALLLIGLAAGCGSAAKTEDGRAVPAWTEVDWPFLLDEWGTGQAFRCAHESCGPEARLFVRVKRGFCNCVQGVGDDDEVDRLTDFGFLSGPSRPLGQGRAVVAGDMSGRMRAFAIDSPKAASRRAVSLVLAKNCNAVVATLISDGAVSVASGPNIVDLLPRSILASLP